MKKIALLLCIILCISVFVSCNNHSRNPGEYTEYSGDSPIYPPPEPAYDVERGAFNIMISSKKDLPFTNNMLGTADHYECDSKDGGNERIYGLLKRELFEPNTIVTENFVEDVRANGLADTSKYDLLIGTAEEFSVLANEGYLLDIYSIKDGSTKDWFEYETFATGWGDIQILDENVSKQMERNGKLYYTKNYYTVDDYAYVMAYIPDKFEKLGLTTPKEYVEKNQWTIDTWYTLVKSIEKDINNVDTVYFPELNKVFMAGAGLFTAEHDGEKYIPGNAWTTDSVKTKSVLDKCKEIFSSERTRLMTYEDRVDNVELMLSYAYLALSYSGTPYNEVAPFPKYDDKQENYYAILPENSLFLAIPSNVKGSYRTVCALAKMESDSYWQLYREVSESYASKASGGRSANKEYFDKLYDARLVDAGILYDFGGMRSNVLDVDIRSNDIMSKYEENKNAIIEAMKK